MKKRIADIIASFLLSKNINNIFMLTGYGAMYLNDAIQQSGIKYFAARNEAAAPMMAESYARVKGQTAAVCVTAGPGATNAIPGLAEAWVDSAPIMIFSGQVDKKYTTHFLNIQGLRTYGTAEINIIPIVKPITKYAAVIDNPRLVKFHLEKAYYIANAGRPGPVWLDIPLDVQQSYVEEKNLKIFSLPVKNLIKPKYSDIKKIIKLIKKSKNPLIVAGQGIRQSNTISQFKKLITKLKIPVLFSRLGQDILPHNAPYIYGQAGVKGSRFCKSIMNQSDLILVLGSRLAIQFTGLNFEAFSKKAKIIMVDIDKAEFKKPMKIYFKVNQDLKFFMPAFLKKVSKESFPSWLQWVNACNYLKRNNPILKNISKENPIDLYLFMQRLGEISKKNNILITDAGSNYYIGGQVWEFKKGQREVTSGANAAMGLSIPLAIGASVAEPNNEIIAVTGDGSLELNIQELKTISHYKFNIKLFVINNGGYVSMINWQDKFFGGRRIDTSEDTGSGTLNLKNIAKAFELKWCLIDDVKNIDSKLKDILGQKGPMFIEVITKHQQKIFDVFKDE